MALQSGNLQSGTISISVSNHTSCNNGVLQTMDPFIGGSNDYFFHNNNGLDNGQPAPNPGGTFTCTNCTSSGSAFSGVYGRFANTGYSVTFANLTVTNPHRLGANPKPGYGTDSDAAVAVAIDGGSGVNVPGNFHFIGTNVSCNNGNMPYYFDLNGSNNSFDATGSLSGQTATCGNGLNNGNCQNTVA